ncbi:MAG: HprK-related kinase B [Gammaproteobacteria bacterium]|nr:HprK-related kinase B [Gammaproteobacteria bacterium]
MTMTPAAAAVALRGDAVLTPDALHLGLQGCSLRLRSNSTALIDRLNDYFSHVVIAPCDPDLEIVAVERDAPELGVAFVDWQREPGKTGRKDSYLDLNGARLVRKIRTGMVFLQGTADRIAAGPCLRYDNQVINFINAQYMSWLQNREWLICHASGLVRNGRCLAIAGLSGGGKSTLMLRMMDDPGVAYLTNDRLFIRTGDGLTEAVGIPKLPRINPGTIVHNPALHGLMTAEQRDAFLAMPPDQLWTMEDKYDVHLERVYGAGRIAERASLSAFLVLNWERNSEKPLKVERVNLDERRDLLSAIMKSPGPFYQFTDGCFFSDTMTLDQAAYLKSLAGIDIYEASGGIDFDALSQHCLNELIGGKK